MVVNNTFPQRKSLKNAIINFSLSSYDNVKLLITLIREEHLEEEQFTQT